MLKYNENLDRFEGDDDTDIDDDEETNNGDVMTIDDLLDNEEVDPDNEEPTADDFAQDFIGFGGPGSGRYPAGSTSETSEKDPVHVERERMGLPDTPSNYRAVSDVREDFDEVNAAWSRRI
jgi:hypothetical protein